MDKKKEVIKHSSSIQISNKTTLFQRKAWNVMLAHAFNDLENYDVKKFSIPVSTLYSYLGYKHTDKSSSKKVEEILRGLINTSIEWNILGKDKEYAKEEWGAVGLLAGCKVRNGICEYDYSVFLREKLANPRMYARINLTMQNRFSSKYSLALYELFVDYKGIGETPVIDVSDFRTLAGLESEEYRLFKDLNKYIIKKAVSEINKHSNLWIEVEYRRSGRTVTALKFYIKVTKELPYPPEIPVLAEKNKKTVKKSNTLKKPDAVKKPPSDDMQSILNLVPVKISDPIRKLIADYHKSKGYEYVKRNLEYTNNQIRDKRKYKAYLGKSLANDYALDWIEDKADAVADEEIRIKTETEKQKKATEKRVNKKDAKRLELHDQLKAELKAMPAERIEELRKGCLKDAAPYVRKRLERMPVSKLVSNPSFLDYCALAVVI